VLALQRTVGNRAVAAMIARDARANEAEPVDAKPQAASRAVIEMGALGKIPIESWSLGRRASSSGSGTGMVDFQNMTLTGRGGKHSPKLWQAVAEGKHFESAVVDAGHVVHRLTDVVVMSYQTSGGGDGDEDSVQESWSVDFARYEVEYREGKDK